MTPTPYFDPENENRPYIAVNAVFLDVKEGRQHILLGKRKGVAGQGKYYLPGGHIKMNESIQEACRREVLEECGVHVTVGTCLWIEENYKGPHHITFYYQVTLEHKTDEIVNVEPEKCEGWNWYPLDNPPAPLWVTLGTFIREYTNRERIKRFGGEGDDFIGNAAVALVVRRKDGKKVEMHDDITLNPQDLDVLLQKRSEKTRDKNKAWSCPGGGMNWGERVIDTLIRETAEEIGVEPEVGPLLYIHEQVEPERGKHWIVHMYLTTVDESKVENKEPEKFDDLKWFPLTELPSPLDYGVTDCVDELSRRFHCASTL